MIFNKCLVAAGLSDYPAEAIAWPCGGVKAKARTTAEYWFVAQSP